MTTAPLVNLLEGLLADHPIAAAGIPKAMFILFIVVIAAVIIVGLVMAHKAAKRRREALRAWSAGRGFSYDPSDYDGLENEFPAFSCLRTGSRRHGYNFMHGQMGDRYGWAFDYHYETYSTDSKGNRTTNHHHFSVVILHTGMALQDLSIRSEGLFDKMKGAFGFDDIDFESAEFSRKFWVTAKNKRWAYDILHQETMELLLESPRFKLEIRGPHVMAYRGNKFKPMEFDQAFTLVTGIIDRIPRDIAKELRSQPPE